MLGSLHSDSVYALALVGDSLLISGSFDKSIAFTSIPESGHPAVCARVSTGFRVRAVAVLPGGNMAVGGFDTEGATLLKTPSAVSDIVAIQDAEIVAAR